MEEGELMAIGIVKVWSAAAGCLLWDLYGRVPAPPARQAFMQGRHGVGSQTGRVLEPGTAMETVQRVVQPA